jgi:hypothetical protein
MEEQLAEYAATIQYAHETLQNSGRNAAKKSDGFRELEIALRKHVRKFEDFARALSLQRRVPLEKTKDLAKALQEKTAEGPLPMNIRRQLVTLAAAIVLFHAGVGLRSQGFDYVTDEEEDLIRDAQGLQLRIPLLIKFLDNRIVALGLRERTAKEREEAKKDMDKYEREVKDAAKVKDAEVRARPVNPDVYLRKATRTELMRGYIQITEEVMDNIDDAYDRNLPVREHVEALQKFLSEQLPRFAKFEPSNNAETAALKATISYSEEAIEDCEKALKTLPKTLRTHLLQRNDSSARADLSQSASPTQTPNTPSRNAHRILSVRRTDTYGADAGKPTPDSGE